MEIAQTLRVFVVSSTRSTMLVSFVEYFS